MQIDQQAALLNKPVQAATPVLPSAVRNWRTWMVLAVAVLLLARFALMIAAPLADTTEARYGELARQTAMNGYWLMPHMDAQTPFFAKPPLSTWISAASMKLFGVNEFAARLPDFLAALPALWISALFASALGVRQRWLVVPVLFASPLFFVSAGAVMTDSAQMTIIWAAQYCAWRALDTTRKQGSSWRLGFWALIGLGALSKGLATWALIGMPMIVYALLQRRAMQMLRQVWDWAGVALACAIFLPWYIAAERAYPGFVNYFIVGEHFSRFLVPGWTGDRYGFAHRQPFGAIWVFWIGAALPWMYVFFPRVTAVLRRRVALDPLSCFLWCATLVPLVFFTFSRNIIWTYALTALPSFAVLVAQHIENSSAQAQRRTAAGLFIFALLVAVATPLVVKQIGRNSDRALVQEFYKLAPAGTMLQYAGNPAFSSAFYTRGKLQHVSGVGQHKGYVVVDNGDVHGAQVLFANSRRSLVEEK
ncbi:ArnT family glycosyltransferase [Pseudoduganella sp. RAF53_2]|uniref:ArnT family glycosyltransferase n=1 Tax=unclassified Pseudoduganella TaxID=2637179 RepID=UPI003F9DF6DA